MPDYRAAILVGPRGPFAIVEVTERQHQRLTPDDRQQVARCLREKHRNLPVVFVVAGASTLHAIHGIDVTDDVQSCLGTYRPQGVPWVTYEQAHPSPS